MAKEKIAVEFDETVHADDLKKLIKEASDHLLQAESFRTKMKDARDTAKVELGVDGKLFNQLLKIYHKDAREVYEAEKDEVVELYDSIFPVKP